MALIKIKNITGRDVGEINLSTEGIQFEGDNYDPNFYDFIKKILAEGLPIYSEEYDSDRQAYIMKKSKLFPRDPLFEISFRNFLTRETGYRIYENDTELMKKINNFSADIRDDNIEKKEILAKISEMSHLEQTLLLNELNQED